MNEKKKLIIIAGPTAVGKSALGIKLAQMTEGEIISADSMQVYRGMDIGTAKVTPKEMNGIPHHLIDILSPDMPFDVYTFVSLAREKIEEISSRGRLPIIVGGTGFYIRSVLYDTHFEDEDSDPMLREELAGYAAKEGNEALHFLLKETDPEAAAVLHPNDVKRVIRAIEYKRLTGESITEHNKREALRESPYDFKYFAITDDRAAIYERIDSRVDRMMEAGLTDEVKTLILSGCRPEMTSMQGIGYKQLIRYLSGEYDLDEAVRLIKRDSRHFAKRQLTWLGGEKEIIYIDRRTLPDTDSQAADIMEILKKDGWFNK